ncbi:MAG TPA: glycosyltransferase family 2 protein [Actinopolymorphaceae bacterium]
MHERVRNVFIDVRRTVWTPDGAHTIALQLALESGDVEVVRLDPVRLTPGTHDVMVRVVDPDGTTSEVPARVRDDYEGRKSLRPAVVAGHVVTPIVRMPERTLAIDVDEATRPVTFAWDPLPSEARGALTARGLDLSVDVPCIGTEDGSTYRCDLVLDGGDHFLPMAGTLTPGPGGVGLLRGNVPPGRLAVGREYRLLLAHPRFGSTRVGLDLVIDHTGQVGTRQSIRVSVIVPVYNAGDHLGECVGSALSQTMSSNQYEVIVVDDGSVDGSGALLDWLTTLHPQLVVLHLNRQERRHELPDRSSDGYIGAPRNVGLAEARGEYVFFLDATDRLTSTALADLYDFGRTYDADIVVARTAGRDVSQAPFRRSKPYATLANTPLADTLTPNKLFRRAFLDRHGLRFGTEHRLEGHKFVASAYLLRPKISVFADRVCCHRQAYPPPPLSPTSSARTPQGYAASLRDALAMVDRLVDDTLAGGGSDADAVGSRRKERERRRFRRRWYRVEVLQRLRGSALLELSEAERVTWFDELRELAREHFPLALTDGMSASNRLTGALLELGRLEALVELAAWETAIEPAVTVTHLYWKHRTLYLGVDAELRSEGRPLFVRADDRVLLDPPLTAAGWTALIERYGTDFVDASGPAKRQQVEVILRNPRTGKTHRFRVSGSSPTAIPVGDLRLSPGRWPMSVRISVCGWTREVPLVAGAAALTRQHTDPPPLYPFPAADKNTAPLALDVATGRSRPTVVRQKLPGPLRAWTRKLQYAAQDGTDILLHG